MFHGELCACPLLYLHQRLNKQVHGGWTQDRNCFVLCLKSLKGQMINNDGKGCRNVMSQKDTCVFCCNWVQNHSRNWPKNKKVELGVLLLLLYLLKGLKGHEGKLRPRGARNEKWKHFEKLYFKLKNSCSCQSLRKELMLSANEEHRNKEARSCLWIA